MATATLTVEPDNDTMEMIERGGLVIQRVTLINEELNRALQLTDQILRKLTETTRIDDDYLALLCMAHRGALRIGRCLQSTAEYTLRREVSSMAQHDGRWGSCPDGTARCIEYIHLLDHPDDPTCHDKEGV